MADDQKITMQDITFDTTDNDGNPVKDYCGKPGAYGDVCKVIVNKGKQGERIAILKQWHPSLVPLHSMFVREISFNQFLREDPHENIAAFLHSEAATGKLIFEYSGEYLDSYMVGRDFSPSRDIPKIIPQLLSAVQHLHRLKVIHRDIKPANLCYDKGRLKIVNLSSARPIDDLPPLRPYTPGRGTVWYRAPEMLEEFEDYGKPVDVWSVGCVLGEMMLNDHLVHQRAERHRALYQPELPPNYEQLTENQKTKVLKECVQEMINARSRDSSPRRTLRSIAEACPDFTDLLLKMLEQDQRVRIPAEAAYDAAAQATQRAV